MNFNIRAGMRILYKQGNSNWMIGNIANGNAEINEQGLWIPVIPKNITNKEEIHFTEINQTFTDAIKLEDWMKDNLIQKEDYIKIIQQEGFEKNLENAWFSDGEYYYYPISKFSEGWIMRQPFDYVIRGY